MKYTEDYRRLVGMKGQGRLIGGLEGYQGRSLISGPSEDVLDMLALGFGGFDDLGAEETHTYIVRIKGPDGKTTEYARWNTTQTNAVSKFNDLVNSYEPTHTLYLTVWMDWGAYTNNPKEVAVSSRTGAKQIAKPPPPVGKIRYAFRKNGKVEKEEDYSTESEAYAYFLSYKTRSLNTDTVDLVKVSTGEVVASGKGDKAPAVMVQWTIRTYRPDGTERTEISKGGSTNEGSLMEFVNRGLDELAAKAYTNETVIARKADGTELGRRTGTVPAPPLVLPKVTYWIYKKTPDKTGDQPVKSIQATTLDEAKAMTLEYANELNISEEAILYDLNMVQLVRYSGKQKGTVEPPTPPTPPVPPTPPEPEVTPEPSKLPDMTDVTTSMNAGIEKFKTFMTAQAVKNVPNGVWVGIGVLAIVGVGIAAATMKK